MNKGPSRGSGPTRATDEGEVWTPHSEGVVVWKWGGGVLGKGEGIELALNRLSEHRGPVLAVFSALGDVTELLKGFSGSKNPALLDQTLSLYMDAAEQWVKPGLLQEFRSRLKGLRNSLLESGSTDFILASGELLSTWLLSSILEGRRMASGILTVMDEDFPIIVTDHPEDGYPVLKECFSLGPSLKTRLEESGDILLVQGFAGRTREGTIRTLGRGGSDTSAIVLAGIAGAGEAVLWKESEGIRTADPRIIERTTLARRISYSEAKNISKFGGKIVHHKAVRIAEETKIRILVPYVRDPAIFSMIDGQGSEAEVVKYVGGTLDAVRYSGSTEEMESLRETCRENPDLTDYWHYTGGDFEFQEVVLLGRERFYRAFKKRIGEETALVAIVGDPLRSASGVIQRASAPLTRRKIVLTDIQTGGSRDSYVIFFVRAGDWKETVKILHEEFVANPAVSGTQ